MTSIHNSHKVQLDTLGAELPEWPTADDTPDWDVDCRPAPLVLQQTLPLAQALSASPWLQRIHTHAPQQDVLPRLYVIEGSLLPGLIPLKNGDDSVWYIRMPSAEHSALKALCRGSQVSLAPAELDHPWCMNWVTISVADDHPEPQEGLMLSIEPHERVWKDPTWGIHIVYECEGMVYRMSRTELWMRDPTPDDDEAEWLVDAESRITKVFRKLQARTRDWEAGRRASGAAAYCRTLSVPTYKASSQSDLEILGVAPLPGTAATDFYLQRGVPAGIGRLSVLLDAVPPGLESDERTWVCLNVAPTLFAELAKGFGTPGAARLESSIAYQQPREGGFYVVYVQVGLLAAATELGYADGRFADTLSTWAQAGECPLVVQNKHNGATLVFTLPWPTEVAAVAPGQVSVAGRPNGLKQPGYALCRYLAQMSDGPPLLYLYPSDLLGEAAWQDMIRGADDVWTWSDRAGARLTKQERDARLAQAGVQVQLAVPTVPPQSWVLQRIQRERHLNPETTQLYALDADALPELLPASLAGHSVWYICLPDHLQQDVPALLGDVVASSRVVWSSDPGFDEWGFDIHVPAMLSRTFTTLRGRGRFGRRLFLGHVTDMLILVVECAGQRCVSSVSLMHESELERYEGSRFVRYEPKWRSWNAKQKIQRAQEDGLPRATEQHDGVLEMNVVPLLQGGAPVYTEIQQPSFVFHGHHGAIRPAVVGELPHIVPWLPPAMRQASGKWLRMTVDAGMFDEMQTQVCEAWMEHIQVDGVGGRSTSQLLVITKCGAYIAAVLVDPTDPRFAAAIYTWAAEGRCSLWLENWHNGRGQAVSVPWPADAIPQDVRPDSECIHVLSSYPGRYLPEQLKARLAEIMPAFNPSLKLVLSPLIDQAGWKAFERTYEKSST